ncbi:MAG TPA: transcriptional regulator [Acidimicrobiales bacterium]|nr:transcriptional regulator [Acidimicrobiales bacterium]
MKDDEVATGYESRVGERLRSVRKQQRLSLQAVEAASDEEFKASVLGAYERGERAISVPRLQRLARCYNVPVDQLLPRNSGAGGDAGDGSGDHMDGATSLTIDLARLEQVGAPEREVLSRFLGMIQVERQDFNGRVLTVRHDDVWAIASLLDTRPDLVADRLDELGLCR